MSARGVLLSMALMGCSLGGPDSGPAIPPSNSAVTDVIVPAALAGDATIRFTLVDPESDPIDLRVEYSPDDGWSWFAATVSTPLSGLPSSPTGVEGTLTWDSLDLGFRGQEGILRLTPFDPVGVGTPGSAPVPAPDNLRLAAAGVDFYMVHYGPFDIASLRLAETYDLVVVHPFAGNLTRAEIREIQNGADATDPKDDVLVLGYLSIGEDLRTIGVSDAQMLQDPRFVGDGSGPRIDPRGPDADGQSLGGIAPLGDPSNGGTGYASWYLDDNSVDNDPSGIGDGVPDRNPIFGGCFVNAGDPKWLDALDDMRFDSPDGIPGIREILTLDHGRGYGCDGLFLDTIDTCAPNAFTDATSPNQSEFEWTAPGFRDFIRALRARYPRTLVLQNRGLFLFDPRHPHYAVTTRPYVDYVKFESFRLNSNTFEDYDPYFFPDNKYNIAPKLMAEANRPDGFRVLSLGYAEGPGIELGTLVGTSSVGFDSLVTDIVETQEAVGFRHYLTDGLVRLPNGFVREHADMVDVAPPVWTSTYNANTRPFPTPPDPPDPRIGIQEAAAGQDFVTVRWDVALDLNRVRYALYYDTAPLDFGADPDLASATRLVLDPVIGSGYVDGVGPGVYPHEATVGGLTEGTTYHFCIRAFDERGNEEKNQVVASATPLGLVTIAIDGDFSDWAAIPVRHVDPDDVADSAGPDWREIQAVNDLDYLYVRYTSENAFNVDGSPAYGYSRTLILIDIDDDAATGYAYGSVGSELMVNGDGLYRQATGVFNDGFLQTLAMTPTSAVTECELAIPLTHLYAVAPGARRIRLVFINDEVNDVAPDSGYLDYTLVK